MADITDFLLDDYIERVSSTRLGKAVSRNDKQCRKGPCPWCGGTDRFAVFVNDIPMHYFCGVHGNGCRRHGDAIDFARDYFSMSYLAACRELDVDPGPALTEARSKSFARDVPPLKIWQEAATVFCEQSVLDLESDDKAYKSLLSRGFSEKIIKGYKLGWNSSSDKVDPSFWGVDMEEGKKLWLPRGWVIPYYVGGILWKVSIRRPKQDLEAHKKWMVEHGQQGEPAKYVVIPGSSQCLYGADEIAPDRPLVLTEGPFDKLALTQAVDPRRIRCVALGSTGDARGDRWIKEIRWASSVLLAFDDDPAGDKAAREWKELLGRGIRLIPWQHDVNDMLLHKSDIPSWIEQGLQIVERTKDKRQIWMPVDSPVATQDYVPSPTLAKTAGDVGSVVQPAASAQAKQVKRQQKRDLSTGERQLVEEFKVAIVKRQQAGRFLFLANAPRAYGNEYRTHTLFHRNGPRTLAEYTQIILDALQGDFADWAVDDMNRLISDAHSLKSDVA